MWLHLIILWLYEIRLWLYLKIYYNNFIIFDNNMIIFYNIMIIFDNIMIIFDNNLIIFNNNMIIFDNITINNSFSKLIVNWILKLSIKNFNSSFRIVSILSRSLIKMLQILIGMSTILYNLYDVFSVFEYTKPGGWPSPCLSSKLVCWLKRLNQIVALFWCIRSSNKFVPFLYRQIKVCLWLLFK